MNKLITTASVISFLGLSVVGASNISSAGSEGFFYPSNLNKNKIESKKSKESIKSQDSRDFLNLLNENEKNRLKYDYIFGLFLNFGEGEISIDDLETEIKNRTKLCKAKEKEAYENDAGKLEKLLATTTREVWEKFEKVVKADKERLLKKKINIADVQKVHKEKAIKWFSGQYGMENKKEDKKVTSDSLEDRVDYEGNLFKEKDVNTSKSLENAGKNIGRGG